MRIEPNHYPPYSPPLGTPSYWRHEQSGVLEAAILRTWTGTPDEDDVLNVRDYFSHWVDAPMWEKNPEMNNERANQLAILRQSIKTVDNVESLKQWHEQALMMGIDPL